MATELNQLKTDNEVVVEIFSDIAHVSWAGWTDYFLNLGAANNDGTVTIPADKVARWRRQIATPYSRLTEGEKESDRIEARKYMDALEGLSMFTQPDAYLLALRSQMADAGLHVQTVAEGITFLLTLFQSQGAPDGWVGSRFDVDAGAN